MAYDRFRRFFTETSLEWKCRWFLGFGTLLMVGVSFLLYARLTEDLTYDQLANMGRRLVVPVMQRAHLQAQPELLESLVDLERQTEEPWPAPLRQYRYQVLIPDSAQSEHQAMPEEKETLLQFETDPKLVEVIPKANTQAQNYIYFAAVRAAQSCLKCHADTSTLAKQATKPDAALNTPAKPMKKFNVGDLMAVVRVEISTEMILDRQHTNRAWLLAFAVLTTSLVLVVNYFVIRLVIVRPLLSLKATADAITAGDTTSRSDLQTGDEFEDLAQTFNRMLASLIQIQDRNRKLLAELEARLDELSHKNWELQQNNAMKSEYLSTMSHELRTPLNSVIGFSEALLGVKSLDERQLRWVANIHDSGQHLLSLINDVLDLAKLESGKMKVKREYVNVALLCTQVVSLFKPQAENKSLELLLNVPDNLPDLRTDQGKLRQILSNLLSNALKFTPDGGRITLKSWQANGVAYFSVADTGIGIAAEHQSVIFQKFRQSTASLTREAGGTGLGLSIVRELCKLLGGDIAVQSEPGRGSTFTVNILAQMSEELIDPLLLDADAFQSSSK